MEGQRLSKLEFELSEQHKSFAQSTPYEIFDLWEGCGRKNVQTRYYELVKTHHPDRYGGNTSSRLKKLTQAIFLQIQDAYQELTVKEDGPQTKQAPDVERAEKLSRIQSKPDRQGESIQYKRMRQTGQFETKSKDSVYEAFTISERDASTLEEPSQPEEDRRAKLAKLARTARSKTVRPPITQILSHHGSSTLEEDSTLSIEERREKLANLSTRSKSHTFTAPSTPTSPGLQSDSVPLADVASSGTIRGVSSQVARAQINIAQHKQDFTLGVQEFREARYKRAFTLIEGAHEAEPSNMLYQTYYAYLLFMLNPEEKEESEKLLRQALESEDKLALPEANLFMGYIYKASGGPRDLQRSYRHFKVALQLNPSSHEAEREVRLYEMRSKQDSNPRQQNEVGGFFKRLFKK